MEKGSNPTLTELAYKQTAMGLAALLRHTDLM